MKNALVPLCAVALLAAAASQTQSKLGSWDLKTAQINANVASGQFSAPSPITLTRGDGSVITADRAVGNYKQKVATLLGHVSVHDAGGTFGLKSAQGAQSRGPATLTADELKVNDTTHLYDASGHVHYEQGNTSADAQSAHLNDVTHILDLSGKVHVVQGDRTMDAEHIVYNTQTGLGTADKDVTVLFPGITPSIATPKPITIHGPAVP